MKDSYVWITFIIIGVIGSTVRYLHEIGKGNETFSLKRWTTNTIIGATIAVVSGIVCRHLELGEEITYAIVAISAISSKELMDASPEIITKIILRMKK